MSELPKSHEFGAHPAEKAEDCGECWATQFVCPNCGPCTNAMVMTTKCCARCQTRPHGVGNDVGLIRVAYTRGCPAHEGES